MFSVTLVMAVSVLVLKMGWLYELYQQRLASCHIPINNIRNTSFFLEKDSVNYIIITDMPINIKCSLFDVAQFF